MDGKKIIKNKGGLHNRLNHRISLNPFPLGLCEKLARSRGIVLNRKQILEAYMIFGGVPYYWSLLQKGTSITAEIDRLIFRLTESYMTNLRCYMLLYSKTRTILSCN